MAYRLKTGIYQIKCGEPNCPFDAKFQVKQNIMGITEQDVETEARKIASGMAAIKHDAIYGNKHKLKASSILKVTGQFERVGAI